MAKRKLELHYDASGIDEKLLNKKAKGIRYIGKRKFNKAADKGMQYIFVGKTSLKKAYKDDEEALIFDDHEYRIAEPKFSKFTKVGGYIPVGDKRYLEYRKRPLILIILLLLLLLGCAGGAAWYFWPSMVYDYSVIEPDYVNTEVDEHQEDLTEADQITGLITYITLPNGDIFFDGKLLQAPFELAGMDVGSVPDTALYSGTAHIQVYLNSDGEPQLLIDSDETFVSGVFGDLTLDFSILKAELVAGIYDGEITVVYPDGSEVTKPLTIVVRNSFGGTMDIGFSDTADVYLSDDSISLKYKSGYLATHDTILQIILDRDGQEFLLAQSGVVSPGHSLNRLNLIPAMHSRLSPGTYSGRMRFNFYNGEIVENSVGMNTDVVISVVVH